MTESQRFDNIADVYAARASSLRQHANEMIDLANKYRRLAQDAREALLAEEASVRAPNQKPWSALDLK